MLVLRCLALGVSSTFCSVHVSIHVMLLGVQAWCWGNIHQLPGGRAGGLIRVLTRVLMCWAELAKDGSAAWADQCQRSASVLCWGQLIA